jgi:hypothetical protein
MLKEKNLSCIVILRKVYVIGETSKYSLKKSNPIIP